MTRKKNIKSSSAQRRKMLQVRNLGLQKERTRTIEHIKESKIQLFIFLILILTDQSGQRNDNNNVFSDYSLCISEMNKSNVTRYEREKLRTLCYNLPALTKYMYSVI